MFNRLLLIACLFGSIHLAHAHDPGLSRANIEFNATGTTVQMVFARQDIEALVAMDTNGDRAVTADEFSAAQSRLRATLAAGVEIRDLKRAVQPRSVRVARALSDAVTVELYYKNINASEIQIHLPLIARLARGHRQYLTVHNATDSVVAQYILDADSPPISLQSPGSEAFLVFRQYLVEGIWHIWFGFDHILFLLTLLLPAVLVYRKPHWQSQSDLRPAIVDTLKVVTAFTLAHSMTLALAVLDIVVPPSRLVESVIACSVLITAVNNLRPIFPASRWLLAFAFGLVHGFGFAGVLADLGLPGQALSISLLGFNLGVEVGQVAIVALVFPAAAFLRHTSLYRVWVFRGGSAVAALVASVWMFERIFNYEMLGF